MILVAHDEYLRSAERERDRFTAAASGEALPTRAITASLVDRRGRRLAAADSGDGELRRAASANREGVFFEFSLPRILLGGFNFFDVPAEEIARLVQQVDAIDEVQGHLITVDCIGGEIPATATLAATLTALDKPYVIHASRILSGGYWAGCGAEEIVLTSAASEVGSIGAMFRIEAEDLESDDVEVYASASTRKNEDIRALRRGDQGPIRAQLDEIVSAFHATVRRHRPSVSASALDGAVYYGREAIRLGLADSIGNRGYALRRLASHARARSAALSSLN